MATTPETVTLFNVIHLALGLLIISLTTLALAIISMLVPSAPSVTTSFVVGACLGTALSSVLVFVVWKYHL